MDSGKFEGPAVAHPYGRPLITRIDLVAISIAARRMSGGQSRYVGASSAENVHLSWSGGLAVASCPTRAIQTSHNLVPRVGSARRRRLRRPVRTLARRTPLGVLLHSRYRQYTLAATLSHTSFGGAMLMRGWMVSDFTGSPFLVSLVLGLFMLPMLVFTTAGGMLADRYSLTRLTAAGDVFSFIWYVVLAALVLSDTADAWHVLALSFAHGSSAALTSPARQTMVTDLVPPAEGRTAIGLSTLSFNVSQIVGPLVVGILISQVSLDSAVLFPVLLVVPSSLLYLRLKLRRRRTVSGEAASSLLARLFGGIVYVVKEPSLRWSMLGATVLVLTANTWGALFPSLVDSLGEGASGLAVLSMAVGAGSVTGTLASVMLSSRYDDRTIETASGLLFVILVFALGISGIFTLSVVFALLAALAATVFFVTTMMGMQLSAPPEVRGRVIAALFVMFGMGPLGMFALGALAQVVGPGAALASFAVIGGIGYLAVQAIRWNLEPDVPSASSLS